MGNNYDFDHNFKYNYDSQVSLTINLPKTCYSKGEFITGNLYLKTKQYLQEKYLVNPQASVSLTELHNRGQQESDLDIYTPDDKSKKNKIEEEILLFTYEMNLFRYSGANLLQGISIPFRFQIPFNCFPSCIFDSNTYIRHLLSFNFTSIKAKKTAIIIIKNDKYFSLENKLYKSPATLTRKVSKHQYAIFSKGYFSATITLPKNSFSYDEAIPFLVEIDCSNLTIQVRSITVSLYVMQTVKNINDIKENSVLKIKEIMDKNILLTKGDKKYLIDDIIKFPSTLDNPKYVYQKLDSDKRNFSQKFKNIFLLPSLYNKILTCEYYIKVMLEMDSYFSTNESLEIPIEFYEDDHSNINNININKAKNEQNLNNKVTNINNFDNYVNQLPTLEELERNKNQRSMIPNNNYQNNNIPLQKSLAMPRNPYNNYFNNNNINNNNYNQQSQIQYYPNYDDFINSNNNNNNSNLNNNNIINYSEENNKNKNENNNKDSIEEEDNTNKIEDSDAPPTIGQMLGNNNN